MSTTATVELLQKAFEDNPDNAREIAAFTGMRVGKFDKTRAKQWLDNMKEDHLEHELDKGVRPWDLVRLTDKLDPKQPWFGIEYETGYKSKGAYQKIVNYLWQQHPFTAIDYEGCGRYPCEITFSPVNMDVFMSDDYAMDKLIDFSVKNDAAKTPHRKDNFVGTHLNVSTPRYRKLSRAQQNKVVELLNNSFHRLTDAHKRELFGRLPYAWCYEQNNGREAWIEGKMFDSVGTVEAWRAYKPVMANCAEVIDAVSSKIDKHVVNRSSVTGEEWTWDYQDRNPRERLYIENMYEILAGKEKKIKLAYFQG